MAEPQAAPDVGGTATRGNSFGWVGRQWALTVVVLVVLVGLGIVADRRFRVGCLVIAGGFVVGAGLRAVLPERAVGLLRLRSRFIDVAVLAVLGLATGVLAVAVPGAR
jgi:hypothetical protein